MAIGSVCAALVHVAVMPDHFRQSAWYGSFFLAAAISQVVFAVAVVVRPTRRVVIAGIAGCSLVVVLWLITRLVGVPIGPDNGATESFGLLDILASVAEIAVIGAGVGALWTWDATPAWRWAQWSRTMRLAAPSCVAVALAASLLGSRS